MLPLRHLAAAAALAWPLLSLAGPLESLADTALARVSRTLVPGAPGELRGRVVRADGTPVRRFAVNANAFDDPNGNFRILVPPEGEFRVVVRAEGFAPNVVHVQGAAGKKLVMPEITLSQGEDFFGEVLDAETGQPVVAARVGLADPSKVERLRLVRPERLGDSATTGLGGYFHIRRAPRGLLMLVVHHPQYLTEFVPVNTRDRTVTVRMHRGGTIAGEVKGLRGETLVGVKVAAVSDAALDGGEAWTDAEGRYRFLALRPGPYTVLARAAGGTAALTPSPVQVTDGRVETVAFQVNPGKKMELPEIQLGGSAPPTGPLANR